MTFIKQTLKNTASLMLAVWIIGSAYAAISTVSSGDPLTADSWNQIVNKISNTDTNSDDLVTKSYVDATVSANSWGYPVTSTLSNISSSSMYFKDAINYCHNLSENWFSDWRVPTSDELMQYVWSSTSTDKILWTSSITHRTVNEIMWINISDWSYNDYSLDTYVFTRCVR